MNKRRLKYFDSLSDKELIDILLTDDDEAVEYLLFYRCNGIFAHIIRTVFFFKMEKEDMITDFYLYLSENNWSKLRGFSQKSNLNTWLTVVAIRFFQKKSILMTKIGEKETLIEEKQNQKVANSLFVDADEHDLTRFELYEAINRLSNPKHKWVLLSELQGISPEEMAQEMECTVEAVYNTKKRAKARLKIMLDERYVN